MLLAFSSIVRSYIIVVVFFVLLTACDNVNGPSEVPLKAIAGQDQMVIPGDTVTLDGTASTGPAGFTYEWSYSGNVDENEINFQNKNTATPTFTPPKSGLYVFTLVVSHGSSTSEDVVLIESSSSLTIGGTLSTDLTLRDVQIDPEKPDYILESDLIVPAGISLIIGDDNVVVHAMDDKGIVINDGTLTNAMDEETAYEPVKFTATNGWKGIQVNAGTINLRGAQIEKAGSAPFEGQTEAGAIVFSGTDPEIINLRNNSFVSSLSYDVLAMTDVKGERTFTNNTLSYTIPIKANITILATLDALDNPNHYPAVYDYVHLVPSGASKSDVVPFGFIFDAGTYYIDGDFRAGSSVIIYQDVTVLMKENAGILAEADISLWGGQTGSIVIDGLNGAPWKGIAATPGSSVNLRHSIMSNAGSAPIDFGDFRADAAAAVYITGQHIPGTIDNLRILNSNGYGIYFDSEEALSYTITNGLISNTEMAGIRVPSHLVTRVVNTSGNLTFDMKADIPAVLVQMDGTPPNFHWRPLNDDNFYLIDATLVYDREYGPNLRAGVHLKFASGRALICDTEFTTWMALFSASGTADNPVIIAGEEDRPGSWGGIFIRTNKFLLDHCIIKNGGEFILPGATYPANIVNSYQGPSFPNAVTNSTISNSAGYGAVQEPYSRGFDFLAPEHNNTFSDNALGDFIVVE